MKLIKKIGIILFAAIMCFQTVACSITKEDIETLESVISTIENLENKYKENTTEKERETISSIVSSSLDSGEDKEKIVYRFRNDNLLTQHYNKHGIEMGFDTKAEYEAAASAVVNNPKALHKKEAEDNDDVYYIEETNEFVIVSTDGYIRTYFKPNAGKAYFDKQ